MPTGYTAPLYEGTEIDFPTFVLRCARAMGPTVLLRDHKTDVLPTEKNVLEDEEYAKTRLANAQRQLKWFREASDEEIVRVTNKHNEEQEENRRRTREEDSHRREAYESMLSKVQAWTPPTDDHVGLKQFMIEQLTSSIKHDIYGADIDGWYASRTPEEHRAKEIANAERDLVYYAERLEEMRERNELRARWIRELRESLGEGVPA